jgi:hypothetical protein
MQLWNVYLICAIAGGVVLILRLILILIGIDYGDVDLDAGLDVDGESAFPLVSIQSVAGFFTMFGLVGMGLLQINAAPIWSLAGALAAGVFTAWCTAMIFYLLRRLNSEGTLVIENAIGKQGTVYLTIPEKGTGAVNVSVQGSLRTLDAVSSEGQRIPTGSVVEVTGVTAGNLLVVSELNTNSSLTS